MTDQPELSACPFCGAANTDAGFIGHTDDCYLMLKYMGEAKKAQLIKAWNRRPLEDALRAEVAILRERCAELESRLDLYHGNMMDVLEAENERLKARAAELVEQSNKIYSELKLCETAVEEQQSSLFRASEIEESLRAEIETLRATVRDNEAYFMEQKNAHAILYANAQMERKAKTSLCECLEWALDLLDMYDERMVQHGDPENMVYSETHMKGMAHARQTLKLAGWPPVVTGNHHQHNGDILPTGMEGQMSEPPGT